MPVNARNEMPIYCSCGKLIAKVRDEKIYVMCRGCKHEVEIPIPKTTEHKRAESH